MTPSTFRLLGNLVLALCVALLIVLISGMAGWTPRLTYTRELLLLTMVMSILARGLRRRGRAVSAPTSGS